MNASSPSNPDHPNPVTPEDARASLADIDHVIRQTRLAIAHGCSAPLLILWGCIWMVGYTGTHFQPQFAGWLWLVLIPIGVVSSWIIGARSQSVVKSPNDSRIGAFWFILFGYAVIWLMLLGSHYLPRGDEWVRQHPLQSRQIGAFFATVPMFAYVVGGLWLGRFFIWLGAIVTALTLIGYVLLPTWFNLWMAFAGGGALIASGVFIRRCWR